MNPPRFTLEKIKFATDPPTYKKACDLYESGKVIDFKDNGFSYFAKVKGTEIYNVVVDAKYYDQGDCNCYLGNNGTLYKHIVALAIYALLRGSKIPKEQTQIYTKPICSNRVGKLNKEETAQVKKDITNAIKYIKPYNGPSRIWFDYQRSLTEGVHRLSAIVSKLPVSQQTAELLVSLLLRLDKKLLTSGVDDSDGVVGGFMEDLVAVLMEYKILDKEVVKSFNRLVGIRSCFGWEEALVKILDE